MSQQRFEWKVGVFVVFALLLLAALVVSFSKGFSLVKSAYLITLKTTDVGGIKSRASVQMAGVGIGNVTSIDLAPDGRTVTLTLKIQEQYQIHRDAQFTIEQSGLLGDQFISIVATGNKGAVLKEGDEVMTAPSTDFKVMLRSASDLIQKAQETMAGLQAAVDRVDKLVVNEANLTSLARAVTNFEGVSIRASGTLDRLDGLVATNAAAVHDAVTNFAAFSQQLKELGAELNSVVVTNKDEITRAVKNVEAASGIARDLVADLKAGKGVAGGLLRNDELKLETQTLVSNLTALSSNLNVASDRLNHEGLWRFLWKPGVPQTNPAPASRYQGRSPFK